ncbi:MAG: hypothetical protein COB73_09845 [Flavobacteriaceae bacterium]|nr:MAG: hypothetical protein COB73_09845 [Flavobacteriaceae bacterium]
MKKYTILLITFLFTTTMIAQSSFTNGFNNGYKKGYCQDQGIGCIDPIPPNAPIPKIGENSDNYTDGYNRGFQMGLSARKSNSNSNERTRYKTAKPKFVDNVMYKAPNTENKAKNKMAELVERGMQNVIYGNYDNAINDANILLLEMEYYIQSAYLIKSKSYYHKNEMTKAYDFSLKITNPDYLMWKATFPTLYLKYLKELLSTKNYQTVINDCENMQNKKAFIDANYFIAIGYYFQEDYKKAKKHFKDARDNTQKNDYFYVSTNEFLESIENENYIKNPYLKN